MQIDGRLLVATHLDQSNYVANQQQVLGTSYSLSKLYVYQNNWAKTIQRDVAA
jgi:hypothetical protein